MRRKLFVDGWMSRIARRAAPVLIALLWCAGNAMAQTNPPSGCTINANPPTLLSTGGTVGLSVSCTGGADPTGYAWFRVDAGAETPIPGGASTTDTLPPNSGTNPIIYGYAVIISSAGGTGFGATGGTVTVLPPGGSAPALDGCRIAAQPSSFPAAGGRVDLTVTCSVGTIAQVGNWNRCIGASTGGADFCVALPGTAATNSDTLPQNQTANPILYIYVALPQNQNQVSAPAASGLVYVAPGQVSPTPPTGCAVSPPSTALTAAGGDVALSVACTGGAAPTSYAWTRNGSVVAGATGATLTDALPANTGASAQTYTYVAAVNSAGNAAVQATPATVVVAPASPLPPSGCAVSPPATSLSSAGGDVALSVACTGGATPTSYAWTKNGSVVPGATGATLTDALPANTGTSAQTYAYVASVNSAGNAAVQATPASVIVAPVSPLPPSGCAVSALPTSLPSAGGPVTLTVACTGGATPTGYAWTRNGSTVAGATGPSLSDTLPANTGTSPQTYSYAATVNSAGNAGVAATPAVVSVSAASTVSSVTPSAGSEQSGQPGAPLPTDFVVDVRDGSGNPVPDGTTVVWSIVAPGTGSFSVNPSTTVNGLAATRFTVGPGAGTRTVLATSNGQTATFTVAVTGNPDLAPVVQQTATVQQQIAIGAARTQLANVRTRLDQLRLQSNPAVASGLRISYGGKPLPWQVLAQAAATKSDATSAPADPFERNGVFVQGDVEVGHQSSVGTASGFDLRTKGLTLGIDHRFDGNHVLGASVGLLRAKTTLRDDGGNQDAKGYSFSVYGSYSVAENGYVNLIGNIGRNDYDGSRNLSGGGSAASSTDGTQYGIALSAGYDFYRDALAIGPYGRVEYMHARIDPFTETGVAPDAALTMGEQNVNATFLALGGQLNWAISTTWGIVQPNARLEWQYQASGNSNTVSASFGGATPSSVDIAGQDKSYGLGSVGVQFILPYSIQAYFNFESPFGKSNYSGQRYTLGVRLGF